MTATEKTFWILFEEAGAARAYFHTWWALRNLALPDFYKTMNNHKFVDFFHVANAGTYNLIFVSMAKFFDRDDRAIGISKLKEKLLEEGHNRLVDQINNALNPIENTIKKILNIRNKSIAHTQQDLATERVYESNGVTPDEIRSVIDVMCDIMNDAASVLGIQNSISEGTRLEEATRNMLVQLRNGAM